MTKGWAGLSKKVTGRSPIWADYRFFQIGLNGSGPIRSNIEPERSGPKGPGWVYLIFFYNNRQLDKIIKKIKKVILPVWAGPVNWFPCDLTIAGRSGYPVPKYYLAYSGLRPNPALPDPFVPVRSGLKPVRTRARPGPDRQV